MYHCCCATGTWKAFASLLQRGNRRCAEAVIRYALRQAVAERRSSGHRIASQTATNRKPKRVPFAPSAPGISSVKYCCRWR